MGAYDDGIEHISGLEVDIGRLGFEEGNSDSGSSSSSSFSASVSRFKGSRGKGVERGTREKPKTTRVPAKGKGGAMKDKVRVAGGGLSMRGKAAMGGGVRDARGGGRVGLNDSVGSSSSSSSSIEFLPQDESSPFALEPSIIVPETPTSPTLTRRAISPAWHSSSVAAAAATVAAAAAAASSRFRRPSSPQKCIVICDTPSPLPAPGKENFGGNKTDSRVKRSGGKERENGREVVVVSSDSDVVGSSDEDMTLRERVRRMMKK